jgi:uncharacterized protein YceK
MLKKIGCLIILSVLLSGCAVVSKVDRTGYTFSLKVADSA